MDSLAAVSKAIAGFIATALATWLAQQGFVLDQGFTGALSIVLAGFFGFLVVYVSPKNRGSK